MVWIVRFKNTHVTLLLKEEMILSKLSLFLCFFFEIIFYFITNFMSFFSFSWNFFFILLFYSILHGERNFKEGGIWCNCHVSKWWEVRHFWSFSGSLWEGWSGMKDTWNRRTCAPCLRMKDSQSYNDGKSATSSRRGDDDKRFHSFWG